MKVILFSNEDQHFYAHLLPIALAAKNKGYEVKVLTRVKDHKQKIIDQGLNLIPLNMERFSLNIFKELKTLYRIILVYKWEKPDIVQHFGIKPILYGSLASLWCKIPKVINTFLGMGFVFMSRKLWVRGLRTMVVQVLKFCMLKTNSLIIVQNKDDRDLIIKSKMIKADRVFVQCSVGVKTKGFPLLAEPEGVPVFALVARMIYDKGIAEFVAAAKIIKSKGLSARFWLVGEPDGNNSRSISVEQLRRWESENIIEWLGFTNDIKSIWQRAHISVLPSYREGLSRSLLESAAYGRPMITTDVPGCRELVQDQVNGLLVKVQDVDSLAHAMERLILNPGLRKGLGKKAREIVLKEYDEKIIVERMLKFYHIPVKG